MRSWAASLSTRAPDQAGKKALANRTAVSKVILGQANLSSER